MTATPKSGFFRKNALLLLAFVVLLAVAAVFAIGAIRHARDWDIAADQPIEAWMTPRYIAHSWGLPRDMMMETLKLEPSPDGPQPLSEIAEERGVPVADLIAQIEAAVAEFRAQQK